jgi:hypothetical protein
MKTVETPQTRCRVGIARCDITPPVGIYHRMWGAAKHERASGVHRALVAKVVWMVPENGDKSQAVVMATLDHCLFDDSEIVLFRSAIAAAVNVAADQVLICVSHTHAAGLMSRTRALLPGGELIGPYLNDLSSKLADLAREAAEVSQPATIVYGTGRCNLAANRDFFDVERQQFVCGFNPDGSADDTLVVAKICADDGKTVGTIVNYACHATTLAWQNTLISPDYVGALRETVERQTGAPCIFLQGASADLGPREGFVGETEIADRNGRQLAYAALAAIESLPPPGMHYVYAGPIVSGATIGTWRHEAVAIVSRDRQTVWNVARWNEASSYREDLPTIAAAEAELASWSTQEREATAAGQNEQAHVCHARVEQAQRQLWRLYSLPRPQFPLPVTVAKLGEAIWVFVAGEHYQNLQTALRSQFSNQAIIVSTITNGWQPGYIPPAEIYGRGIYQEQIAVVAPGSAEQLLTAISRQIAILVS